MNENSDMQRIIHDLETDTASESHTTDDGKKAETGPSLRTPS